MAPERDRELIFSARKKDFTVQTFRSGGPGGQHQNKTSSGVRIIHKETGLFAECREHRSQPMNKKVAFRKLVEKLVKHYCEKEQKERYSAGMEVVRTYHEPDDRITDHQTGDQYSFKDVFSRGNIEKMIEERAKKMVGK